MNTDEHRSRADKDRRALVPEGAYSPELGRHALLIHLSVFIGG
jgi:hypothetical protein